MKANIVIERWEWPILKAKPSGFECIELSLREPSQVVEVRATITLKDARLFADHLITLANALEGARK